MGQAVNLYHFNGQDVSYSYPLHTVTQNQSYPIVNLYLHSIDATPSLTSNANIDDTVLNIDTNNNLTNVGVITIYEGTRVFQTLIVSSTSN